MFESDLRLKSEISRMRETRKKDGGIHSPHHSGGLASGDGILSILQRITLPCNNSAIVCRGTLDLAHSGLHAVINQRVSSSERHSRRLSAIISADLVTSTCIAYAWRMHIRAPSPQSQGRNGWRCDIESAFGQFKILVGVREK